MGKTRSTANDLPGGLKIILPGVPCRTSRGWLGYCSIVLLRIDDSWALFDTGHYSDRALLLDSLQRNGLSPLDIRQVIVSHLHFDHILNIPLFRNASLLISGAEIRYADDVSAGRIDDPAIPDNWHEIIGEHEVRQVEGELRLDAVTEVEVLPGHTPGGLVVYRRDARTVAVCGDVIKNAWEAFNGEPAAAPSPARLAQEEERVTGMDLTASRKSIRQVLEKVEIIIPGHDRPFTMRSGVVDFLSEFHWEVRGSLMPRPQDEVMLDISLPATHEPLY